MSHITIDAKLTKEDTLKHLVLSFPENFMGNAFKKQLG